jgi:Zn finger protein HypA/HybF involved in hydrogenase expression
MVGQRSLEDKFINVISMINKIDLLTEEEFKELIKNSSSSADVLRALGYSVIGNSWAYRIIAERMDKLNITFGKMFYLKPTESNSKLPLEKVLIKDSGYNRTKLKDRLIKEGIKEYKCECCGLMEWNGKPIILQLHHLNGIHNDNRLSNLQLLCPNCHSQTENFGTRGKGLVIKRKSDNLPLEDKELIINTVAEVGIVEARKRLPYRNSLINSLIKNVREKNNNDYTFW